MTDEPDIFAEAHAERGYTIGAYFPPAVPWEIVDGAFDHLADHVHAYTDGRWDVSVVGGAGDQLGVVGEPELTRTEALELVDDLGLQTYRAEDRLAFVREMCDQADRDGTPVTTEQVRSWLAYEGCGGVLQLPDEVVALMREHAAADGVAGPATKVGEPARTAVIRDAGREPAVLAIPANELDPLLALAADTPPPVVEMTAEEWQRLEAETAMSGVDTPGCDCGHDGLGVRWHASDCTWRAGEQR